MDQFDNDIAGRAVPRPAKRQVKRAPWRVLPLKVGVLIMGTFFLWAIVTYTLVGPLAKYSPKLALMLNANHPVALVAKAEGLRNELFALMEQGDTDTVQEPARDPTAIRSRIDRNSLEAGSGRFAKPLGRSNAQTALELRAEIEVLAKRAIEQTPLNSTAYRLLAETRTDRDEVRALMEKAVARSPREANAMSWLMLDAVERGDSDMAVDTADKLMRTQPQLVATVLKKSAPVLLAPKVQPLLVARLSEFPNWRSSFLRVVSPYFEQPNLHVQLFKSLAKTANPPTVEELASLIVSLINREEPKLAHAAWRDLVPRSESVEAGKLFNAGFDRQFSGYAFDWTTTIGDGATIDRVDLELGRSGLRLRLEGRRVRGLSVRQVVLLAPGKYVLGGRYRGGLAAQRGVRWQVRCLYGTRELLGQSDPILKGSQDWEQFTFGFDVVDVPDCAAQALVLIHDARTASEEIASGELQFDELALTDNQPEPGKTVVESSDGGKRQNLLNNGSPK